MVNFSKNSESFLHTLLKYFVLQNTSDVFYSLGLLTIFSTFFSKQGKRETPQWFCSPSTVYKTRRSLYAKLFRIPTHLCCIPWCTRNDLIIKGTLEEETNTHLHNVHHGRPVLWVRSDMRLDAAHSGYGTSFHCCHKLGACVVYIAKQKHMDIKSSLRPSTPHLGICMWCDSEEGMCVWCAGLFLPRHTSRWLVLSLWPHILYRLHRTHSHKLYSYSSPPTQ